MNFNFYMPARVISGKNAVADNKNELKKFGGKCLIITGGSSAEKSGALNDIKSALESINTQYEIFNKISPNPKAEDCRLAGETARDLGCEFIIGTGGGSVLDAAKAAAVYAANKHLAAQDIYSSEIMLPPIPLVLIGTTAGTGSEVTGVSVLTRENGKKKSVSGENYYAKTVLADPKYTYTVPYYQTVSTAIDAFAHATESYFSNKADLNSFLYAEKALKPLFSALKYFYETQSLPDENMRDELYYSSLNAGMAINGTGTCFPHTMGYALTEDYNIPHGLACAAFCPRFVKRAMKYKNELSMSYFNILGTNYPEFEKIITTLAPTNDISMTLEQIDNYCQNWENVKNFKNSPGGFTKVDARELLTKLFLK